MKLIAEAGKGKLNIEIKRQGNRVSANIEGRKYELEASEPEPGVLLLKHDGRIYEASVTSPAANEKTTHVRIGNNEFDIRLIDPKRLRGTGAAADHGDGPAEIKTAMPGKVVRVLVNAGDRVENGDGIIVVEAMKMQNELKSPKAGVVKEICASEGTTVAAGDILARIE